ncbi:MAG: hypothetical protein ACT4PT_02260 [Methanobacteriota archaeon]
MLAGETKRKAIHVLGAVAPIPVLLYAPISVGVALTAAAILAITISYDISLSGRPVHPWHAPIHRRITRALDETRRDGETFPWASVLFLFGVTLVAVLNWLAALPLAFAFAAYGVLGAGDTMSALVGSRYGRHKLPWNRRKSWEGSLAGLVAAATAAVVFSWVYFAVAGDAFPRWMVPVAVFGAGVGMLLESLVKTEHPGPDVRGARRLLRLVSRQDNFVLPVASYGAMVLTASLVGVL